MSDDSREDTQVQWAWAHFTTIRLCLIAATLVLTIVGLVTLCTGDLRTALIAWNSAYLCKCVECWLLHKALVKAQRALGEAS